MNENTLLSYVLRWGMIIAGINILLMLIIYVVDATQLASISVGLFTFVLNIALIVYAGVGYRKLLGGYADYKTMLITVFLIQAISGGAASMFQVLMYTVIDPELPELLTEASLETTENMLEFFNLPPDDIDDALEQTEEDLEGTFSARQIIVSYFWPGLLFLFIIALIIAAIIKKNKPIFED